MSLRQASSSQTHLECRYFHSFIVDLDCLVVVNRLSFPADGLGGAAPPKDGDLRFTAHVHCHGAPMHHGPVSTSSCPERALGGGSPFAHLGDGSGGGGGVPPGAAVSLVWDEVLTFPVKVRARHRFGANCAPTPGT